MTNWNDILESDASAFFEMTSETITYRPKVGAVREIEAIVDREPNDMPAGGAVGLLARPVITVRNNATTGVTSAELDIGADQFKLGAKEDTTTTYFRVARLLRQDAGLISIELKSR